MLARWLLRDCRVLLLDEPTRGVDVGARTEIYQLDPLARRPRRRRRRRLQRDRGGARSRRPGPRRPRGRGRPRVRRHRDRRGQGPRPRHGRKGSGMSQDSARVEQAALETDRESPTRSLAAAAHQRRPQPRPRRRAAADLPRRRRSRRATGSRRPTTRSTILRLAATIGVVSIGMTFVIIGGGIDLSVGAIVALSSVWCTTVATQTMAEDTHWLVMVVVALAVGAGCGLINGLLIAYGKIVPFIATLAMLASARGLAEIISDRKTQIVTVDGFTDFFNRRDPRHPDAGLDLRAGRGRRLGPAQPHHVRPPHRRGRRQPRGRPAGRHQRQAAHRLPLRAGRPLLRHRRADAGRPDHDRQRRRTATSTSSTRSRRSSSAARCSPAAAAPSSAPCSAS